jgi:acetyl-CoA C-acetyltransferase
MGVCGESCASKFGFSRKDQDDYAIQSYARAAEAWSSGKFKDEVAPISVKKKGQTQVVSQDEEYTNIQIDKIPQLKPAFKKDGTVTAANASTLVCYFAPICRSKYNLLKLFLRMMVRQQ